MKYIIYTIKLLRICSYIFLVISLIQGISISAQAISVAHQIYSGMYFIMATLFFITIYIVNTIKESSSETNKKTYSQNQYLNKSTNTVEKQDNTIK